MAENTVADTNRQHEIDRLRLLLQKATGARKALMVEIEPGEHGFRIIITGVSAEEETRAAQMVADYMNILMKGAIRFSIAAIEGLNGKWSTKDDQLLGTIQKLSTSPDAFSTVPEEPQETGAVDPVGELAKRDPTTREVDSPSDSPASERVPDAGPLITPEQEEDLTRVDGFPEGAHGDLPRRATE